VFLEQPSDKTLFVDGKKEPVRSVEATGSSVQFDLAEENPVVAREQTTY
jgi:hypothetical protein